MTPARAAESRAYRYCDMAVSHKRWRVSPIRMSIKDAAEGEACRRRSHAYRQKIYRLRACA